MSTTTNRATAYKEFVFYNLPQAVKAGQGAYNYKELAAMLGLKTTQHFKRRVRELASMGILKITPAFTLSGGIENRFTFNEILDQEELPF